MKVKVRIKPGKKVVLSVVIVACSSGLTLVSSLIGPWLKTHALMIRPYPTFDCQTFCVVQNPSECLVTAIIINK